MTHKTKARHLVARHTQHGLNRTSAKKQQLICSLGTERAYAQALSSYIKWCDLNGVHPDNYSNRKQLVNYLEERREWVAQKTLDQERQALQLVYKQKLLYVRSQKDSILAKRSYTLSQVNAIASRQTEKNALTTLIAFHAGLRAHEPATLLPLLERGPSNHRIWDSKRFLGFPQHKRYTVIGKGGLVREVAIPLWLADRLEARRIPPAKIKDRGIFYMANYDIGFGQAWSQSFSSASQRALGYSTGAHGLRHSYAKKRIFELIAALELSACCTETQNVNEQALLILSQELGHFRLDIVFCYLR